MLGKILLTLDAIGLLFGAPLADYNHTHIFNPRWPPHAKFHGAQTITLSVALGLATLYNTWLSGTAGGGGADARRESLRNALFCGTIYWLAGMASILYPGTAGLDPEFGGPGFPQLRLFTAFAGLGVAGWFLESRLM